ncbi:hypothetical protein [Nocardia grenadensis]|uniref:hypothetical protein n=1 Tax=Nocardia grenadensis TaxID=931537 RepID=UPI003D92924A
MRRVLDIAIVLVVLGTALVAPGSAQRWSFPTALELPAGFAPEGIATAGTGGDLRRLRRHPARGILPRDDSWQFKTLMSASKIPALLQRIRFWPGDQVSERMSAISYSATEAP